MLILIESRSKQFPKGKKLELSELLYPTWDTFSNDEKRNIGKEIYQETLKDGTYYGIIKFIEETSEHHKVYEIL